MNLRRVGNWPFALALIWSLSGCLIANLGPTEPLRMVSSVTPTAWDRVQTGEYCEIQALLPAADAGVNSPHPTGRIAGRVASIDETTIVLADAVRFHPQEFHSHDTGMVSKLPYLNRLFKNSGVRVDAVPLPGEIRIPKVAVRGLSVIDPESWPSYRQDGFERIGLDFDFNMESNKQRD
ncbi:MAG: hypothetical protein JSS49_28315 [Planctomycetes bacterium]|nr:hypothetical protein [Planctomycetota bacterium]